MENSKKKQGSIIAILAMIFLAMIAFNKPMFANVCHIEMPFSALEFG